jgi:DNA invertase Pin-like site-specific DNA recombinase
MIVGYARVSSSGQSLDIQEAKLKQAGAERIFAEKRSGTTTTDREELKRAISYCREGDVFVATRLDRIARSVGDLQTIVRELEAKGVGFRCLEQEMDTTTSSGRLLMNVLGAFAEFEADIRKERQGEGIAKAKDAGIYKGRPPSIDPLKVKELKAEGVGPTEIAKRLNISRPSVYRILNEA